LRTFCWSCSGDGRAHPVHPAGPVGRIGVRAGDPRAPVVFQPGSEVISFEDRFPVSEHEEDKKGQMRHLNLVGLLAVVPILSSCASAPSGTPEPNVRVFNIYRTGSEVPPKILDGCEAKGSVSATAPEIEGSVGFSIPRACCQRSDPAQLAVPRTRSSSLLTPTRSRASAGRCAEQLSVAAIILFLQNSPSH
jgi:hypothetical protein